MDRGGWLTALQRDGHALAAAARGRLDVAVGPCPGWTVHDVVVHTGGVYAHKVPILRERMAGPPGRPPPAPDGADPIEWYADQLAELCAVLRATPPETPMWSWYPPRQDALFWTRRMAQETAVHRADVELSDGDPTPVPDDLALDGIDEALRVFVSFGHGVGAAGGGETVAVRAGNRVWRVRLGERGVDVTLGEGAAEAAVSGSPSDVLLYLWGRLPASAVQLDGAAEVLRDVAARVMR